VIRSAGRPVGPPNLKKPTALRGGVGVWDCESGDRIKGCDGACLLAIGFFAGVGSWSVTNVAAFFFCVRRGGSGRSRALVFIEDSRVAAPRECFTYC
jgi:hypothetical protein